MSSHDSQPSPSDNPSLYRAAARGAQRGAAISKELVAIFRFFGGLLDIVAMTLFVAVGLFVRRGVGVLVIWYYGLTAVAMFVGVAIANRDEGPLIFAASIAPFLWLIRATISLGGIAHSPGKHVYSNAHGDFLPAVLFERLAQRLRFPGTLGYPIGVFLTYVLLLTLVAPTNPATTVCLVLALVSEIYIKVRSYVAALIERQVALDRQLEQQEHSAAYADANQPREVEASVTTPGRRRAFERSGVN